MIKLNLHHYLCEVNKSSSNIKRQKHFEQKDFLFSQPQTSKYIMKVSEAKSVNSDNKKPKSDLSTHRNLQTYKIRKSLAEKPDTFSLLTKSKYKHF